MTIPYHMPMQYFLGAAWEANQKPFLSSLKRRGKKHKREAQKARLRKKYQIFRGRESASEKLQTYELLYILKRDASETVYLARSKDNPGRHVHLKTTQFTLNDYLADHRITPLQRKRFKVEQRVLSRMNHANIARLYETGLTQEGNLYFVSEAVSGKTLMSYCNEHQLDLQERLELAADIAEAVHHAHSKGIFHRAVYPSNILITQRDGKPHPVLVNLGLAGYPGGPVFQPPTNEARGYSAPPPPVSESEIPAFQREVAEEIYTLGALVHHLLTGVTPNEPPKPTDDPPGPNGLITPSHRWKTLPDELRREYARERGVHERDVLRELKSDLEPVMLKALDPNPESRYLTAWNLAVDLRAHVQDRPVTAHPRSTAYIAGKFLCRHKRVVATAALCSAWFLIRAL